jgi:hypothetical protein
MQYSVGVTNDNHSLIMGFSGECCPFCCDRNSVWESAYRATFRRGRGGKSGGEKMPARKHGIASPGFDTAEAHRLLNHRLATTVLKVKVEKKEFMQVAVSRVDSNASWHSKSRAAFAYKR